LKKKLADLDKRVTVKVEGCDNAEINGTYIQCGMLNGAPKFCKSGQWDGEDIVFTIYLDGSAWAISIIRDTGKFWYLVIMKIQSYQMNTTSFISRSLSLSIFR
jgi:hypothetical protein